MYWQMCCCDSHPEATPALFPRVYVNWLNSKQKRDNKKNPYIVDFAMKHSDLGSEAITIIEIDGRSHYSSWNEQKSQYIASESAYADHLKKDRWLRKKGFNVIRISNLEIEQIMSQKKQDRLECFHSFFNENIGKVTEMADYWS